VALEYTLAVTQITTAYRRRFSSDGQTSGQRRAVLWASGHRLRRDNILAVANSSEPD
jgi:hypothetical protein